MFKISEHLEDVQRKANLSYQQADLMKQQSMMTTLYADEEKIVEPSTQCNFQGNESPGVPAIMIEKQQEDDEEIFKKLKNHWMPKGLSSASEGKCIDSKNENLQISIKQYKYQI